MQEKKCMEADTNSCRSGFVPVSRKYPLICSVGSSGFTIFAVFSHDSITVPDNIVDNIRKQDVESSMRVGSPPF